MFANSPMREEWHLIDMTQGENGFCSSIDE